MVINEIISAILQIGLFTLIPFIAFTVRTKSAKGFFHYIGLIPANKTAVLLSIAASLIFLAGALTLIFLDNTIRAVMITPPSITGKLREMGFHPETLLVLFIIACFKTSLAEEILFRGFIARQLIKRLGYAKGNLLQSGIFAAVHLLLFAAITDAGPAFLLFIFLFSGLAGYIIGFIKEKKANGSIIPGWIAHGLGNVISYSIIAFVI